MRLYECVQEELPDDYSDSKDWKQGNSVSRIQWLKIMLESYRAEVNRLEDQMDYRSLLKKFVAYLNDVEGYDFIDPINYRYKSDSQFTDEEWATLRAISAEVTAEE